MIDQLHHKLLLMENQLHESFSIVTVPIYDPSNLPQDAVECQIAIGTDGSLMWYSSGSWHSQAGTASVVNSIPQDCIDGQIAIGTDNSFHWRINDTWYTAAFAETSGNPPQDAVTGQIAIGNADNFCWYVA